MNLAAADLVSHLRGHGVRLSVRQDKLLIDAPRGVITLELTSVLTARKLDIISLLQPATVHRKIHSTVFRVEVDSKLIIVICPESVTEENVMPRLLQKFGPDRVTEVSRIS